MERNASSKNVSTLSGSRRRFIQGAGALASGILAHSSEGAAAVARAEAPETSAGTSPGTSPGARLRKLLAGPDFVMAPVVYDVMSAKLVELAGIPAVFAGGQPCSNSMYGMGDFGGPTLAFENKQPLAPLPG